MAEKVGYVPGVWDLFHVGHLNILRQARQHCDVLVAGVVTDEMALLAKGRLPVVPLAERLEIVEHIVHVDRAVAEDVPDKLTMWERLRFDVLIKGDDWKGTPKGDRLERDLATVGVSVAYFPYTAHTSSTLLRRALDLLSTPATELPTALASELTAEIESAGDEEERPEAPAAGLPSQRPDPARW